MGSFFITIEKTVKLRGPKLFISLPASIRNIVDQLVEKLKNSLGRYLHSVPDQPSFGGYSGLKQPDSKFEDDGEAWSQTKP